MRLTDHGHSVKPRHNPKDRNGDLLADTTPLILIGAYERDNFGDLLFLIQTAHYLDALGVPWIAASPFPGDPSLVPFRGNVTRLTDLDELDCSPHFWSVGGELGGATIEAAFPMSAPPDLYREYVAAAAPQRREIVEAYALQNPHDLAYIPGDSVLRRAPRSRLTINSAGLSGLRVPRGSAGRRMLESLAQAEISVRDSVSSKHLSSLGLRHYMAPDLVHTLLYTHPLSRLRLPRITVQASLRALTEGGVEELARQLARLDTPNDVAIVFLIAGTARGHDSVEAYMQVQRILHRMHPGLATSIHTDVDPIEKACLIASSRLWIGSSLHGRIIASTYGVPRVSLSGRKLSAYAEAWDPEMPFAVGIHDVALAAETALSPARQRLSVDVGQDLAALGHANMKRLMEVSLADRSRLAESARRIRARHIARTALLRRSSREIMLAFRSRANGLTIVRRAG